MCGIAGILNFSSTVEEASLKSLSQGISYRGPDAEGLWINSQKNFGFVHRRLSILDLSERSNQPMSYQNLKISYNGEIYNFHELKNSLEEAHKNFHTTSDTEVLIKLFKQYGESTPQMLRGMFAFAIYDESKDELFLARDHFGMKPLYYLKQGEQFIFSSSMQSLIPFLKHKEYNHQALYSFLRTGHIEEPLTLYKGIELLPAGHFLVANKSGIKIKKYFDLYEFETKSDKSFEESFTDSMKHHLISDVKISLFYSSGLDSSLIGDYLGRTKHSAHAITLSYEEDFQEDEGDDAHRIAKKIKLDHEIVKIKYQNFEESLPDLLQKMDQPSIDGVNTYLIARAAKARGFKVALSGLGGDELFGGYSTFKKMSYYPLLRLSPQNGLLFLTKILKKTNLFPAQKLQELPFHLRNINAYYFYIRSFLSDKEIAEILSPDIYISGKKAFDEWVDSLPLHKNKSIFRTTSDLELSHYMKSQLLRDNDWAAMANSLELRTPFVDIKMLEMQRSYAENKVLKKSAFYQNHYPHLPHEIYKLKKRGFGIPVPMWLKNYSKDQTHSMNLKSWSKFILKNKVDEKLLK